MMFSFSLANRYAQNISVFGENEYLSIYLSIYQKKTYMTKRNISFQLLILLYNSQLLALGEKTFCEKNIFFQKTLKTFFFKEMISYKRSNENVILK